MKWSELCASDEYRGRWVALDGCRYDEATAKPVEGTVIDSDEDLVELCNRIRAAGGRECAILYIEQLAPSAEEHLEPHARRPVRAAVRAVH